MDYDWSRGCDASRNSLQAQEAYMLKIDRSANGQIVFTLSGRIQAEDVKELEQLLASEPPGKQLVLNLRDVTLVNQDAVEFLARCEGDTIMLENCRAYIRQWIERAKNGTKRR
jgi:anti-anti-sigma regulatory factor